jgi:hypothetical protein
VTIIIIIIIAACQSKIFAATQNLSQLPQQTTHFSSKSCESAAISSFSES